MLLAALPLLVLPLVVIASPVQPRDISSSFVAEPWASFVTVAGVATATATATAALVSGITTGGASPSAGGAGNGTVISTSAPSGIATGSACAAFATSGIASHTGSDGTVTVSLPQISQVATAYVSDPVSTEIPAATFTIATGSPSPVKVGLGRGVASSAVSFSLVQPSGSGNDSTATATGLYTTTYAESSQPTTTIYLEPSAYTTSAGCFDPATRSSNYSATLNGSYASTSAAGANATLLPQLAAGQSNDTSGAASILGASIVGVMAVLGASAAVML